MNQTHPAEQAVRAFWEARSRAAAKQAAAAEIQAMQATSRLREKHVPAPRSTGTLG
jgi:hypothetical protein